MKITFNWNGEIVESEVINELKQCYYVKMPDHELNTYILKSKVLSVETTTNKEVATKLNSIGLE